MNIVYHSSDSFAQVTAISIVSIFENNKDVDNITIYIIEKKFSNDSKKKLLEIATRYNRHIVFIPMPDINELEDLGLKKIKEKSIFDSYCRLFLDDLLPDTVERVIYLDGDVLCMGSLSELWNLDMQDKCVAGVIDCIGEAYYKLLDMSAEARYCNSGVILFDLKKWKERKCGERVKEYVHKNNGYVFFMEQTAFNVVMQEEIHILSPKYNTYTMMQVLSYKQLKILRKCERFYSEREIEDAVENPVLVHMTSSFMVVNRPWCEVTTHPMQGECAKYGRLVDAAGNGLIPDGRNLKKKIIDLVIQILPKVILLPVVSLVYNSIRVKIIDRQWKKIKG